MPCEEDCEEQTRQRYEEALRRRELSRENLGFGAVIAATSTMVFGIFSNLVYQNTSNSFVQAEVRWLILLILVMVIGIFMLIQFLIDSDILYHTFKSRETWFNVITSNGQYARMGALFLFTTFITGLWIQQWLNSHFNAIETLCGIWNIFMIIALLLLFAQKTETRPRPQER
jgi:hypothetical protein